MGIEIERKFLVDVPCLQKMHTLRHPSDSPFTMKSGQRTLVKDTKLEGMDPHFLGRAEVIIGAPIEQGYLGQTETVVRVRVVYGKPFGPEKIPTNYSIKEAYLTIKGPGYLTRSEFEYSVPSEDGRHLLSLCETRLSKYRYKLDYGLAGVWEVDEFVDAGEQGSLEGLWLAEIELGREDQDFIRPPWLGAEVTNDRRYSNAVLAEEGWPR